MKGGDKKGSGGAVTAVPAGEGSAGPGGTEREGRQPPNWVPTAILIVIPLTLIATAVGGRAGPQWATASLLVGVLFVLLFIGWWSVPGSARGFISVAGISVASAVATAWALVALTHVVVGASVPTTTSPMQQVSRPARPPDLRNASVDGANLNGAWLEGARLDGISAVRTSMVGAQLSRASLRRAVLSGAVLTGACLRGADLRGAQLDDVVFLGADLGGAQLDENARAIVPSAADQARSRACK